MTLISDDFINYFRRYGRLKVVTLVKMARKWPKNAYFTTKHCQITANYNIFYYYFILHGIIRKMTLISGDFINYFRRYSRLKVLTLVKIAKKFAKVITFKRLYLPKELMKLFEITVIFLVIPCRMR